MEVRDLRLVLAISENGNLTAASRQLYLSQSALSHHLKDLEGRLGVTLFRRADRRMETTYAGQKIAADAKRILSDLDRLSLAVKTNGGAETGVLRTATECYTCYGWLPGLLEQFATKWPRVEVRIVPEATRHSVDALLKGMIDVAITPENGPRERTESVPLFEDELGAVVSRAHRLARRKFLQPQDLSAERLLFYSGPRGSHVYHHFLLPAGVEPETTAEVPLTEAMIEMVRRNFGICFMSTWAFHSLSTRKHLAFVRLGKHGVHRSWSAVMRKPDAGKKYVEDFIALLRRTGAQLEEKK